MLRNKKRGVSLMIGYVLLVVLAVVMGAIFYQWLKTFVPGEALECPEGVSIFVKEVNFNPATSQLSLTLVNNGRFNVVGYFIHAANGSEQEIPTISLATYLNKSLGGGTLGDSVVFDVTGENDFKPNDEATHVFDIPAELNHLIMISVIPTRFQEAGNKQRFVSCGAARVNAFVVILPFFVLFATSTGGHFGNLGGLSGADSHCSSLASNAGLNGTFISLMSDGSLNLIDRLSGVNNEPFTLVNKKIVAKNKTALLSGNIINPINLDENNVLRSGRAWTGTNEFGLSTGFNCNNWNSNSAGLEGTRGDLDGKDFTWTRYNSESCDDDSRFYCIQIE